ncbi:MAG TPA: methyl-accepting chemotaxis protein [Polyangiaceae bacterium]|nr:methyl-accepting chemotaxis protein [Polyangiaceae bacterium]
MSPAPDSGLSRGLATAFSPAASLMDRLTYLRKFLLIATVLLVPLAFLLRLQYSGAESSIVFNASESVGIEYLKPVERFLVDVQRRRILASAVAGGLSKYQPDLQAVTRDADELVGAIDAVDAKHGPLLKTSEKWGAIKIAWTNLKASPLEAGSDDAHAALSGQLIELIVNDAGNNSNLILDPDLDSYWLMDAFVFKLPAIGDSISESAVRALTLPAKYDVEQLMGLAGVRRVITGGMSDLVNVDMKTAFAETKNPKFGQSPTLEPNLKEPLSSLVQSSDKHTDNLKQRLSQPEADRGANEQLVAAAIAALDAIAQLHDKLAPELDWLCLKRVNAYTQSQQQGLMLGLSAVALVAYAFAGFFFSVRGSIAALASATRRMIAGTEETFALVAKDELGNVADSYNQINAALREARDLRERVERDNQELQENIMDLLSVVSDASDGNLTVRAKITSGALGNVSDAFNHLLTSLHKLILEIDAQLRRTNGAVEKISRASSEMATGATTQTREVLAASKLVEDMSRDMQRVSNNARIAAESTKRAQESAEVGAKGVSDVITGMGTLRANVQAGAKKMKNLGDRSMEITSIVGTINRISEQTNMLALNAAIEAVRAGEHGRGFSIVADQVRKLAERTAVATEEIEKLVKAIHDETTDTVQAIEQQTQFVERESELVSQAGESLVQISRVSTESAHLVAQINQVTVQQAEGVSAIAKTMDDISAIAKSTQAGAEGTALTVKELAELSLQLTSSIQRFKLGDGHASNADQFNGAVA